MDIAGLSKLSAQTLVMVVAILGFMVRGIAMILSDLDSIAGIRVRHGRVRGHC
jgi:hypothetical protein